MVCVVEREKRMGPSPSLFFLSVVCRRFSQPFSSNRSKNTTHKVHADGRDVRLAVGVVGEAEKQATLADAAVADEQELFFVCVFVSLSFGVLGFFSCCES